MTKTEIREGIRKIEELWYGNPPDGTIAVNHKTFVSHLMEYLDSQGVVLKVDNLPIITKKGWYYMTERLI